MSRHKRKPTGGLVYRHLVANWTPVPDKTPLCIGHIFYLYMESGKSEAGTVKAIQQRVDEPCNFRIVKNTIRSLVRQFSKFKNVQRDNERAAFDLLCATPFPLHGVSVNKSDVYLLGGNKNSGKRSNDMYSNEALVPLHHQPPGHADASHMPEMSHAVPLMSQALPTQQMDPMSQMVPMPQMPPACEMDPMHQMPPPTSHMAPTSEMPHTYQNPPPMSQVPSMSQMLPMLHSAPAPPPDNRHSSQTARSSHLSPTAQHMASMANPTPNTGNNGVQHSGRGEPKDQYLGSLSLLSKDQTATTSSNQQYNTSAATTLVRGQTSCTPGTAGEGGGINVSTLIRCLNFSAIKHRDQRRKDPQQTPYINHPIGVAHILTEEGGITDINIIQAALLHDTVEDTNTSIEEIGAEFGSIVAGYVSEVTDNKSLDKAVRKQLQIDQAPHCSDGAKLIKLADKLYNLRDLERCTPMGWTDQRVGEYFVWAGKVVYRLRGVNTALDEQLRAILGRNGVMV